MTREVSSTPPVESSSPHVKQPAGSAAGIPAILSTMNHGFGKAGIISSVSTFNRLNKFGGFDCPGCAWPDPDDHRTVAEFCENGAKAVADEATKKRITRRFWEENTVSSLSMKSDQWLNEQGRLTEPMYLEKNADRYVPISWHDAFENIAMKLSELTDPNQAIFYTSGRTSNEAAFLWQLLARAFGTNNLPDCSNMCHESSGFALSDSIGIGKGTVTLDDFNHADLILVVGQNPGSNHPRMLTALSDARKNGASVFSINPLIETGMKKFKHPQKPLEMLGSGSVIADDHLQIRINGDFALFRAVNHLLVKNTSYDREFITKHTSGFEQFQDEIDEVDWQQIQSMTGLPRSRIEDFADTVSKANSIIICWAMGITQHHNSVQTIQEMVNTLLLGGHIGRSGAGVCPVRGHSNVQGDRTVGINHHASPSFISRLQSGTGVKSPTQSGYDSVMSVQAMLNRDASIFLSMGGNFLSAMSDTKAVGRALEQCEMTVNVATKLNRSHLVTGNCALILPCLGRTERDLTSQGPQFVSVENSMGVVHSSRGRNQPASPDLKSEPAIIAGIAQALESKKPLSQINWNHIVEDYDRIRDLIESAIPGFNDYNLRVRERAGFYLPNGPRDDLQFDTDTGKANFLANKLSAIGQGENEFVMMTIRSHDQYNTTVYTSDDRYRGIKGGRRIVLMNPVDAKSLGIQSGDRVNISSTYNEVERLAEDWFLVEYDIPIGNVATYFPEANELIPLESTALGSNTPTSKSVRVKIYKSKVKGSRFWKSSLRKFV